MPNRHAAAGGTPAHRVYRIGELSNATGLTRDTLRYYERRGLLDRPARTPGRFREYGPSALERIGFIKRAQALGFSLDDIHELVSFNGKGGLRRCARVRDLLRDRLAQLEEMLADLGGLRTTLRTALDQCERAIEARDALACPVIELGQARADTTRKSGIGVTTQTGNEDGKADES